MRQIETRYPQIEASEVLFEPDEPGWAIGFGVTPRVNPAIGRLFEPGFNAVYVDPGSGKETGKVDSGAAWPITRASLMSFLYVLHYSLHMPKLWGIDTWGTWLLGGIAMLWTIDCFVGFYLTLPKRRAGAARAGPEDIEAVATRRARHGGSAGSPPGAFGGAAGHTSSTSTCIARSVSGPGCYCLSLRSPHSR